MMATLPLGTAATSIRRGVDRGRWLGDEGSQAVRFVAATAALIVAPQRGGDGFLREAAFGGEVFEQQFDQPAERDAVRLADLREEPCCEMAELGEGGLLIVGR